MPVKLRNLTASLLVAVATMTLTSSGHALEDGDVVRVLIPYGAGGGFDAQARMAAPYIEKVFYESGYPNVKVVPENMQGAGGAIATAHVYEAKPDGTTLLLMDPESSMWQQVVQGAVFDVGNFSVLAQQSAEALGVLVRLNDGLDTFADLLKRSQEEPILFGTTGSGNIDHTIPIVLQQMLADNNQTLNVDFIHLASTADVLASMRRGEAEAMYATLSSSLKAVDEGVADFLFTYADSGPLAARWPHARDVLDLPADQTEHISDASHFRRVYVGPPGMDDATLSLLRDVFDKALNDPELQKKSADSNRPILYLSGQDAAVAIQNEVALGKKFVDVVKENIE